MPELDLGSVVGPQGKQGEIGPPGKQGIQGEPGPAATINGANTLTITAGDNVTLKQEGSALEIGAVVLGKNLLLNGDFRNPVNRNGKAEYTGAGYTIDRFILQSVSGEASIKIGDRCVKLYAKDNDGLHQILEPGVLLCNTNYTCSILTKDGDLLTTSFISPAPGTTGGNTINYPGTIWMLFIWFSENDQTCHVWPVITYNQDSVKEIDIVAMKLEIGSQQTLARQNEDGEWEIIDPPDYDLQYALCSLYSPSTGEWVGYQHSNPNLLDNWYFVDPVNQRGQTEYTATGYTIDRFKIGYSAGSTFTCGVEDNGVSLTAIPKEGETSQFNFYQIIPANLLNQGTYTLSFLYSSDCAVRPFAYSKKIGSVIPGYKDFPASNDPAIAVIPIKITSEMQGGDVIAYAQINTFVEAHVKLYAAKLELGPVQTLAHKEGDTWVLNDPPPNKALELAKCQRYQVPIRLWATYPATWIDANDVNCIVPTPIQMRAAPALQNLSWIIYDNETHIQHKDFNISVYAVTPSGVYLRCSKPNHGISNACVTSSTTGMFDANL